MLEAIETGRGTGMILVDVIFQDHLQEHSGVFSAGKFSFDKSVNHFQC